MRKLNDVTLSELRDERKDLDRLRNLSDGVFAIVFTLLVLNLQVPHMTELRTNTELARALLDLSNVLAGYVVSFLVIGVFWMVHLRIVRRIIHPNRRVLSANLVFLFWLSLLPFSTMLSTGAGRVSLAWGLYAANVALLGLSVVWIWRRAVTLGCVDEHVTPLYGKYIAIRSYSVSAIFFLSAIVAFLDLPLARWTLVILPIWMAVVRRHYRPRLHEEWAALRNPSD